MKLVPLNRLPVVDILKIVDHFNLSEQQTNQLFGFSAADISDMRDFITKCTTTHIKTMIKDVELYREYIIGEKTFDSSDPKRRPSSKSKTKILNAFLNIPSDFTPAIPFCKEWDVSLLTLKQIGRFDKTGLPQTVTFKTINGVVMVRRGYDKSSGV